MAAQLTGGTDLLTYYDLVSCYKKYINQTIDPSLAPYVADLPGKTTVEPDNYMMNLLRDPRIEEDAGNTIEPFDAATLKDAYHLKEGPIPGFDASLIGTDDGSAHDRPMEKQPSGSGGGGASDSERKHRKKKKKRKHSHDHHDEEGSHGDHKKKRKRKKERDHSSRKDENDGASLIID